MPGAISLAATHHGKIKHIIQSTRSENNGPAEACVLDFDKNIADRHDAAMRQVAGSESEHLDEYKKLSRPYRQGYHLSSGLSWVLTMSPLQAQVYTMNIKFYLSRNASLSVSFYCTQSESDTGV